VNVVQLKSNRSWAVASVLATAALLPSLAQAAAGVISTTVAPVIDGVTYSQSAPLLNTYLAYTVTVANGGLNTINKVRFTGEASSLGGAASPAYASVDGLPASACKIVAPIVECQLGTLRAGDKSSFVLFFAAPLAPAGNAAGVAKFSGRTFYAEGENDAPGSVPNSTDLWTSGDVGLGTNNPSLVRSVVRKSGGTIFTNAGGVGTAANPLATTVTVPAGEVYTTAQIAIGAQTQLSCNNFKTCDRAEVTVPGTFFPYMTVLLRQAKDNLAPGAKVESVLVWYQGTDFTGYIGACPALNTPIYDAATGTSIPCINARRFYKNSRTPGWTPALDGSFEIEVIQNENGEFVLT
jgi:hypothetical protein